MKGQWIVCFLVMTFFTVFKANDAQAVVVNLNVLDSHIEVAENFNVEVWVDGEGIGEELLAFGFDVSTTSTVFSYLGYTIESGFDDFSDPFNSSNVTGDVFPGIPNDDVLLATLMFSADSAGMDVLALDGSYDGLFFGLFYEVSGVDLIASTAIAVVASAVSEPNVFLLICFGFFVLQQHRRLCL